ncbi:TetR/AcrR family transcriptional regulator C-terminal domain-containing protein [Streptosporangium sp. OZ121]|uniref:TetR/AcrR family transcriptional regulator C-terminal domain-containing protein n=1 Tax=Streptosporangium sp. OZ121 TaxID=3444183 RepID=UPI003F7A122E
MQIATFYRSLPADRFPNIVAQVDTSMAANGTERFEFGLDLLLRGLVSHVRDAGPTTKG